MNRGIHCKSKVSFMGQVVSTGIHTRNEESSTHTGAKLLHLYWCKPAFWGARLRRKGCWYCDIFAVQTCIFIILCIIIMCI